MSAVSLNADASKLRRRASYGHNTPMSTHFLPPEPPSRSEPRVIVTLVGRYMLRREGEAAMPVPEAQQGQMIQKAGQAVMGVPASQQQANQAQQQAVDAVNGVLQQLADGFKQQTTTSQKLVTAANAIRSQVKEFSADGEAALSLLEA